MIRLLQINENGVISFRRPFRSRFIQDFNNVRSFEAIIAPFWTDLALNRNQFDRILFRRVQNSTTLTRASSLTQEHFPGMDFEPTDVIIVTWYRVGRFFSDPEVCMITKCPGTVLGVACPGTSVTWWSWDGHGMVLGVWHGPGTGVVLGQA